MVLRLRAGLPHQRGGVPDIVAKVFSNCSVVIGSRSWPALASRSRTDGTPAPSGQDRILPRWIKSRVLVAFLGRPEAAWLPRDVIVMRCSAGGACARKAKNTRGRVSAVTILVRLKGHSRGARDHGTPEPEGENNAFHGDRQGQ